MDFDVIIIGGGLSGLTAGSLLAKSGLKIAVIEKSYNPGGSCGVFKRNGATFDIGAAMLFGFGTKASTLIALFLIVWKNRLRW